MTDLERLKARIDWIYRISAWMFAWAMICAVIASVEVAKIFWIIAAFLGGTGWFFMWDWAKWIRRRELDDQT